MEVPIPTVIGWLTGSLGLSMIVFVVTQSGIVQKSATNVISMCINTFLMRRFPIKHEASHESIPTCPYVWPNGQGDVAKFLDGEKNREVWGNQHGQLYRIWSGMNGEIVLTRPEHIKAVFKDSDLHYKAVDNNSGYLMSQVLGQCVGLVSGQSWRRMRTAMDPSFHHKAANASLSLIRNRVNKFLQGITETAKLNQGLVDPAQDFKMLPFWTVAEVIYGQLTPDMTKELSQLAPDREELFRHVIRGGLSRFRFSAYLPTESNRLLESFRKRWSDFNEAAFKSARTRGLQAPIVDLYEACQNQQIRTEEMLQTLDESLYANLDVTTGGLSWNLVFLASNAHLQEELRGELQRHSDSIDAYYRSESTLLASCVSESSRLKPLAAFSVPQAAPTPRLLDGFLVPAGTNFVVDSHALNMDEGFWGPDAKQYNPKRWQDLQSSDLRYRFWRFGFGPRQCLGKYMANNIIRVLIGEMLQRFELKAVGDGGLGTKDPSSWINHPQTQIRLAAL